MAWPPNPGQEPAGLACPGWCGEPAVGGDVLGQRTEVGVGTRVEVAGPLGDPLSDVIVVPSPAKIVNEVGHRFAQRDAARDPIRGVRQSHRMPALRRQDIAQPAAIIVHELREDPL